MAGRAGHRAFGFIRKLPSGRYQASYLGPDQARHTAPTTYTTKARAEGWLAKELALIERREWTSPKARAEAEQAKALQEEADSLTLSEYATGWLERRELKPRTRSDYQRLLDRHIAPSIGRQALKAITPADVNAWYASQNAKTPTERAHAFQLLRTVFNSAVREDLIDKSPCRIVGAGTVKRAKVIEPATLDQLSIIVSSMPDRLKLAVLLGAWGALRYGEIAELRRRDVGENGVIRVRRGASWVGGAAVVGTPKTTAGVRDVHLPPHIVPAIREHLEKHAKPGANALLFPAKSGEHMHPRTFGKAFNKARAAAGRPDLTFHGLRHTGAVLAAQSGATIAELQGRLGHTTPGAAMRYQHAAAGRDAEIARRLSALADATESATGAVP